MCAVRHLRPRLTAVRTSPNLTRKSVRTRAKARPPIPWATARAAGPPARDQLQQLDVVAACGPGMRLRHHPQQLHQQQQHHHATLLRALNRCRARGPS
jgi:hypothetical protein